MTQIKLLQGDCLDKLKELEDNSVDSVVTDPPYHLTSIVKRFGKEGSAPAQYGTDGAYTRASKGFMGKEWDGGDIAFRPDVWEECYRVLKPGGHLLAFSHSRTYHRMGVAVEDAGFEIRDQILWIYGSGFPKSHNVKKQIEKEYKCQFIKHAKTNNATTQLKHFQVELNEEKTDSVVGNVVILQEEGVEKKMEIGMVVDLSTKDMSICVTTEDIKQSTLLSLKKRLEENSNQTNRHITSTELKQIIDLKIWNLLPYQNTLKYIETQNHTALKPSHEPIVMARKPFKGSVAQNVLEWGTGGINIDESRIGYRDEDDLDKAIEKRKSFANTGGGHQTEYVGGKLENPIDTTQSINTQGRFPANIIFDEEAGKILDEQSGTVKGNNGGTGGWMNNYIGGEREKLVDIKSYNDTGGASRFFYCPKASKKDRNEGLDHLEKKQNIFNGKSNNPSKDMKGVEKKFTTQPKSNSHPTVKPTTLMAYLVRLVTPKGGTVLDPFMGSGSTGKAAVREGMDFIGIEREDEYMEIAKTRIEHEQSKHNYRNFWE